MYSRIRKEIVHTILCVGMLAGFAVEVRADNVGVIPEGLAGQTLTYRFDIVRRYRAAATGPAPTPRVD